MLNDTLVTSVKG